MKEYWLHKDAKEVASRMVQDFDSNFYQYNSSPFRAAWARNIAAYYSPMLDPTSTDTSLIFEGVQGELVRMYIPQARSMVRQLVTIVTKQRIAMQGLAEAQGQQVVDDLKLCNALASQIVDNTRLDLKQEILVEAAIVAGSAFTRTVWNTDKGRPYTRDQDGVLIYDGDIEVTTPTVFDVLYDMTIDNWADMPWVQVRVKKNRWDLVAQFPELEQQILALPSANDDKKVTLWWDSSLTNDDMVYIYELYARPSPALENGRVMFYGSADCVLFDAENMYGGLPIQPMIPEPVMGLSVGYPQFTNLLACQEMFDNSISAIATNQAQFAVQSATVARGANVSVQDINGMRFISYSPMNVPGGGKPEPLQLTQSSPETFKFADVLKANMQEMSNINSTLRGTPPPGATSGVAIATLSANALEFTSSLTKSLHLCLEQTVMNGINTYRAMATTPHIVMMRGKTGQMTSKPFVGEDLNAITAVKMTMVNPLMQTIAGRLEIAEKLMEMPRENWPEYVSILEGQPLTKLYDVELSEEDLENSENEILAKGKSVPVLATDDHPCHIQVHAALLNDPIIRLNGKTNQIILDHIMEHYRLSKETDPVLMAMVRTGKMPEGVAQGGAAPGMPGTVPPPHPDVPGAMAPARAGGPGLPPPPPPRDRQGVPGDIAALPTPKTASPSPDMLRRV